MPQSNRIVIAYTEKHSLDKSNNGLQQLSWQAGKPCAFTNQAPVYPDGQDKPVYHSLERASGLETCQNLDIVNDSGEVQNVVAGDDRYKVLSTFRELPNEYHIQSRNQVYDKLSTLPKFAEEVPNAQSTKRLLDYNLWGRRTIAISPSCDLSMSDAHAMIEDIGTAGQTKDLNFQVSWGGMLCFIITGLFYLPFSLLMLWDSFSKQDGTVRFV